MHAQEKVKHPRTGIFKSYLYDMVSFVSDVLLDPTYNPK